jgi:uroporphyrinogen-III synthase
VIEAPIFDIAPRPWGAPAPADIDALLIGSANAIRHAGPDWPLCGQACSCGGAATATGAARAAGLHVVAQGSGGLQWVLDRVAAGHGRLLRLAGEEPRPRPRPPM